MTARYNSQNETSPFPGPAPQLNVRQKYWYGSAAEHVHNGIISSIYFRVKVIHYVLFCSIVHLLIDFFPFLDSALHPLLPHFFLLLLLLFLMLSLPFSVLPLSPCSSLPLLFFLKISHVAH